MNENFPHDIADYKDLTVEQVAQYVEIIEVERELLEPMTPTDRGKWLDEKLAANLKASLGGLAAKPREVGDG